MPEKSFFAELRKRKVVQVAAIYGAVAWGVTEVIVTVTQQLFLPQWLSTLAVIGFAVGFPVAMFLSWTFDLTPEGIRRTEVTSRRGSVSIALSLLLLIAGTAGLYWLIKPGMETQGEAGLTALPNSLAVLPFDNVSQNSDDAYLSDGLSDGLRERLGRVDELRLAARSSSIAMLELGADAVSSARRLGVANLVEGSLRRNGNLLQVSVQLIDGSTGLAIWSNSYQRGQAEFLSLEQDIMENIVNVLMPDETVELPAPATQVATAHEALLLGRHYEMQVRDGEEVDFDLLGKAIDYYREAVDLDPQSALAASRLAGALIMLGELDESEQWIFRALALDPNLSEVQHTRGLYHFARGSPECREAFRRAIDLNPDNADALAYYGFVLWINGNEELVAELYRRALEIDRQSLSRYASLGELLGKQGKTEDVLDVVRGIQRRFEGADAYRAVSRLLELTGALDEAIVWAIRARDLEPGNEDHLGWLSELYAEIGDLETADRLSPTPSVGLLFKMRRYEELIPVAQQLMIDDPDAVLVRYTLGFANQAIEDYEQAIWVLGSTGLPLTAQTLARSGWDWEAYFALMSASLGLGDDNTARALAEWFLDRTHHNSTDWFTEAILGCAHSALGNDERALELLDLTRRSPRIARDYLMKDLLCLKRLAGDPRYQAVIDHFDRRRAELRERLPATLAANGVKL